MTATRPEGTKLPPVEETVSLTPERIKELEARQTGGPPVTLDFADATTLLRLAVEQGPAVLQRLDEQIEEMEQTANALRAQRVRVEAMLRGAKG